MTACREIPFRFHVPIEFFEKAGANGKKERRIGGHISTEHQDLGEEIVLQDGLDFGPFLSTGWVNDNHSKTTWEAIGYPLMVKPSTYKGKRSTYMEAVLFDNHEPADKIWKFAQTIKKYPRKLGFSVEGKVKRRAGINGQIVAKAIVRNVAITNCPVNPYTELEVLSKSLTSMSADRCPGCSAESCILIKSLTAGSTVSNPGTSPGTGFPLRTESLEGQKTTTYAKKKKKKKLRKSEAIDFIRQRFKTIDLETAERIFNFAQGA